LVHIVNVVANPAVANRAIDDQHFFPEFGPRTFPALSPPSFAAPLSR